MKDKDYFLLRLGALGALALSIASPVLAQEYGETSQYETPYGMGYGQTDRPYEMRGLRDAQGNLTIVNGLIQSGSSLGTGLYTQWGATEGYGTLGYGNAQGTAIGNQLNVVVQGNYNTVIVDSTQINNGDQNTYLNGGLDLDD